MDKATVRALIEAAKKNHKRAERRFEKHDNHEDMHEMNRWEATAGWLEHYLT